MVFHGNGRVSFAAICGDHRIRVKEGYINCLSWNIPTPALIRSEYSRHPIAVHDPGARMEVSISMFVGDSGMVVELYDPLTPVPVGSKTVDECTNDELLFALQYRLGLLHGGLIQ
jgi:hypothetical protein